VFVIPEGFDAGGARTMAGRGRTAAERRQWAVVEESVNKARAGSTFNKHRGYWNGWARFAGAGGWRVLPADAEGVVLYMAEQVSSSATKGAVTGAAGAITFMHATLNGIADPAKEAAVRVLVEMVRRERAAPVRKARPLEVQDLRRLVRVFGGKEACDADLLWVTAFAPCNGGARDAAAALRR
jgi:hypothetical protein